MEPRPAAEGEPRRRRRNRGTPARLGRALVACAVLPAFGCWHRPGADQEPFRVVRVSPALGAGEAPLLLNDAITVYFSAAVDPMSITQDTLAVLDADGNAVAGHIRVGDAWVTFEPNPPLTAALTDGSFRPGGDYRLAIAGYPRPDGVRAADGRRLVEGFQRPFRATTLDGAPLRPIAGGTLPFLYRPIEGTPGLPVDDPRLRLHFTLPVLPTSLSTDAFAVILLQDASLARGGVTPEPIVPRAARILALPAAVDEYPGSTVELDLGSQVRSRTSGEWLSLRPGDIVWIRFEEGAAALRDYSGRPLQVPPGTAQGCLVVPGSAATVVEWPTDEEWFPAPGLATPGFEVVGRLVRPHLRQEAGDGSLGILRPTQDLVLAPGLPFDRGDGVRVQSQGSVFAFRAVDIPSGVTVRIAAAGEGVQILALGRMRIAGTLVVEGPARAATVRSGDRVDFGTIVHSAPATLCAAGGLRIDGSIRAAADEAGVPLALVSGGTIDLRGPIPLGSILATELGMRRVTGYAERYRSVTVQLTPGLPAGAEAEAVGLTPFRALPGDRTAGVVRLTGCDPAIAVEWQVAPPDPVRAGAPDPDPARMTPLRPLSDGQHLEAPAGSFLRMRCTAKVRGGEPLPVLASIRWLDH